MYIVGGYNAAATFGSIVFPSASSSVVNNYNTYILKYSAQGQPLWGQATVPASFQDYALLNSVGVDASGNVYVLGDFGPNLTLGTITLSLPQASSAHVFLAKYNPQGTVLWAKMAGSLPPNTVLVSNGYDLAVQADGTATITGTYSQSITFDQLTLGTPGGSNQTYVARYSPQGAVVWAGRAGTITATPAGNTNIGYSVSLDAQGAAYITGDFGGQADFGPFMLTNSTAMLANLFVAKIGATALASRPAESASTLTVYPTPAIGASVTISFAQATPETTDLRVVNAVGQLVRQQTLAPGTSQYTLPTSGLRAGLYRVQALGATSRQAGTLVIP
ncbi:MAG: T9SS type A sorting domain-containing protein [Janthinobacterium lividum]